MSVTFPLPIELQNFGRVAGRFILVSKDTINDADLYPEGIGSRGSVTFTPTVLLTRISNYHAFVGFTPKTFPVDSYGILQDEQVSGGVWLRQATYTVTYSLEGLALPSHTITVTALHTEEAPLLLSNVVPISEPAQTGEIIIQDEHGGTESVDY